VERQQAAWQTVLELGDNPSVAKAMKAVAPDTHRAFFFGDRVSSRDVGIGCMKRCSERRVLRQVWRERRERVNACKVVGVVKGGQWRGGFDPRNDVVGYGAGRDKGCAPMDNTVGGSGKARDRDALTCQAVQNRLQSAVVVWCCNVFVIHPEIEMCQRAADAADLPRHDLCYVGLEQGHLNRAGACVDD